MDIAVETISVQATAPGASASFVAVAGDSLQVRDSKKAILVGLWGNRQTGGFFRLTSPLLHDAVVGIQQQVSFGQTESVRLGFPQELTPQDTLVATGGGSATAGDIESNSYTVMYEGLAGICGKFIDSATLMQQGVELYDSTNTLTLGTAGGYSGSALLNADQDQLKANMDYAILGVSFAVNIGTINTIGYISPDWGNLRVGVAARFLESLQTSNYFLRLAREFNMPLIPVFNASQKSSVFIDALGSELGGSPVITTHMVRLKSGTIFGSKGKR